MHRIFTLIFLLALSFAAYSQSGSRYMKVRQVTVDPDNPSQVKIQYDLISETEEDLYTIRLFLSTPDGERELFKFDVGSEIGEKIKPGIKKTIFWKAADEITDFGQNVVFVIHAKLTFTPIHILYPAGGKKFKRKDFMTIKWEGGVEKLPISINLSSKDGESTEIATGISNEGAYEWTVGKKLKGKYKISIVQGERAAESGFFAVRRRFSMFNRMLIGIAAVGAGGYFYLMSQEPQPLEGPPVPPNR